MTIMDRRPRSDRASGGADAGVPTPWLLRRVSQRYRDELRRAVGEAGYADLPQPGFWALDALATKDCDASQLVSQMGISKQAVSKLIDQLVASAYVERLANPTDRRRVVLRLTTKGRKAAGVLRAATDRTDRALVRRYGTDSLAHLRRLLGQMVEDEQ
jgi:DNA-binding MarR family transcriptional regulator